MRWIARSTPEGYEVKWWPEVADGRPVRFELPENSMDAWRSAVEKLEKEKIGPDFRELPLSAFADCKFYTEIPQLDSRAGRDQAIVFDGPWQQAVLERMSFCKFLLALVRERAIACDGVEKEALVIVMRHTRGLTPRWPYSWVVWPEDGIAGDLPSGKTIYLDPLRSEYEVETWGYVLEDLCQKEGSEGDLADFLDHQDLLWEVVRLRQDVESPHENTVLSGNYLNLIKATVQLLETLQRPEVHPSPAMVRLARRHRPWLCGRLAVHPLLPPDERGRYLEKIFEHRLPDSEERQLLQDTIKPSLVETFRPDDAGRVTAETLLSMIAQHYLDRYQLDDAVKVWEGTSKARQDLPLRMLLLVYRHPWLFVASVLALLVLSLIALEVEKDRALLAWLTGLPLLFAALGITVYAVFTMAAHLAKLQGFSYLELFLPRLLGSVMVGLSLVALEDTVWKVTLRMPWLNWGLIVVASFVGALAYFFLDVHKNTRLAPIDAGGHERSERSMQRPNAVNPLARSVITASKLFAVGALEAIGLTIVVSALLPLSSVQEAPTPGLLTLPIAGSQGMVLSYSPKLILLWAGLALLIGAFAQLLWQDRQITAS